MTSLVYCLLPNCDHSRTLIGLHAYSSAYIYWPLPPFQRTTSNRCWAITQSSKSYLEVTVSAESLFHVPDRETIYYARLVGNPTVPLAIHQEL
jgi:hypothetical protein